MNPEILVDAVLRGVLGGGRKKSTRALNYLTGRGGGSLLNASTLLGAAGVAWGIYETLQREATGSAPVAAAPAPTSPVAVPMVSSPAARQDEALRLVRLAISAANADGAMTEQERSAVASQAEQANVADVVAAELGQPRPLASIVAGVTDPAERRTLYVLAYTILRADEQVLGAERIYLAQLANLLGLDRAAVQALEQNAQARIDAGA
jgi:uncharacterized membrane protein YebE (DUF533 family)